MHCKHLRIAVLKALSGRNFHVDRVTDSSWGRCSSKSLPRSRLTTCRLKSSRSSFNKSLSQGGNPHLLPLRPKTLCIVINSIQFQFRFRRKSCKISRRNPRPTWKLLKQPERLRNRLGMALRNNLCNNNRHRHDH